MGKTRAKLSLWSSKGGLVRTRDRSNQSPRQAGVAQLDVAGIGEWLKAGLVGFAAEARVTAIVPVAHGAAAVLLDGDAVAAAPDYETPIPHEVSAAYDTERDPFASTLSPRLEAGLNLGVQLFQLEGLHPDFWPGGGRVLLWPQFWAWWLSGEHASEVTSLGCHSDLWRPLEGRWSNLAVRRGWTERIGPLRGAGEVLGAVRPSLARELGLPAACRVHVGLHDSNAALHGVRVHGELQGGPFCLVSTGTWFVCLSSGAGPAAYDEALGVLANVDVAGRPVPTARFMGGRMRERWMALGSSAAAAALRLAQATLDALKLVDARGPILIEGRFARDDAYVAALAALCPDRQVYRSALADGVAWGALRLAEPGQTPPADLQRIEV